MKLDKKEFISVQITSLLHDIGKYYYRIYGGEHEQNARNMIRDTIFQDIGFIELMSKGNKEPETKIVRLGDCIASSERDPLEEKAEVSVKKIPLNDIIGGLFDGEEIKLNDFPLSYFDKMGKLNDRVFDNGNFEFNRENLDGFKEEIIKLGKEYKNKKDELLGNEEKMADFLKRLLTIMENRLSNVPSAAYVDKPDIDLYNHSRTAAAISSCLYLYYLDDTGTLDKSRGKIINLTDIMKKILDARNEAMKNKKDIKDEVKQFIEDNKYGIEKQFLLITGDFSGIQDFIASVSSKRALKMLKARSTYLAVLNKVLPYHICREMGLPEMCIISNTGGRFVILAPNKQFVIDKMNSLGKNFNEFLFEKFENKIFLSLTAKEKSAVDIGIYSSLADEDNENSKDDDPKSKKFFDILKNKGFESNEPYGIESKVKRCLSCGISFHSSNKDMCISCSNILLFSNDILKGMALKGIIKKKDFQNMEKMGLLPEGFSNSITHLSDIRINDFGAEKTETLAIGFPLDDKGQIIKFFKEEEEGNSPTLFDFTPEFAKTNYEMLGGLKMDVDNLGEIFMYGLGNNNTFSRQARLSFSFKIFFEHIVEMIRKERYYDKTIYTVYSGGDDAFFIGQWSSLLSFARDLYAEFRKFTHNHEKITISASYMIFSKKYPVRKVYQALEDELHRIKSIKDENWEKNRISVMGTALKWDSFSGNFGLTETLSPEESKVELEKIHNSKSEFEFFWRLSRCLYSMTETGEEKFLNRGALEVIIKELKIIRKSIEGENKTTAIPKVWRLAYYISRKDVKDEKKKEALDALHKALEKAIKDFIADKFAVKQVKMPLDTIIASCKVVQYLTKEGGS